MSAEVPSITLPETPKLILPSPLCVYERIEKKTPWFKQYDIIPSVLGFITGFCVGKYIIKKK